MEKTLFERIGGKDAIETAVDIFYTKVLEDNELKPFFKQTDIKKQKSKQRLFLTYAFGGVDNYNGNSMAKAHAKARDEGLNISHFNKVANHLTNTLKQLNVEPAMIDEVLAIVSTTKSDILGENN